MAIFCLFLLFFIICIIISFFFMYKLLHTYTFENLKYVLIQPIAMKIDEIN